MFGNCISHSEYLSLLLNTLILLHPISVLFRSRLRTLAFLHPQD